MNHVHDSCLIDALFMSRDPPYRAHVDAVLRTPYAELLLTNYGVPNAPLLGREPKIRPGCPNMLDALSS